MIEGPWTESPGTSQEPSEAHATDFNGEAFYIFLMMLHLQPEQIPDNIRLDILRDMAIIAKYYHCMKILRLYGHPCQRFVCS